MRKEQEDKVDPTKPALIVLFGATRRKVRALGSDVVVLGRAPGCDVGLVSPEVSPVHCVLVRLSTGWRIRDCSGRTTLVNGKPVHDEPLSNGDIIQVGTFSFEAHLPAVPAPAAVAPARPAAAPVVADAAPKLERLKQSRRRIAELALNLRRRLRDQVREHGNLERREEDLAQLERRLRHSHQDQQAKQVEWAKEKAALDEQKQKHAARQAELDAYARHLAQQNRKMQQQQTELARQLEADRLGFEQDLVRQQVEIQEEHRRLQQCLNDLQARQAEVERAASSLEEVLSSEREQLERDREQVAREREYLNSERQEVIRQRAEIDRLRELAPGAVVAPTVTPVPPSSHDTLLETQPADRLASARRMLKEMAERRKGTQHAKVLDTPRS